ncbi:hypothetical protein PMAYCL1PPCAC_32492 [Pristionchus mayeri]|uniref:ShKT domain-containing protein n=1 Tax=Pristionchus mayeri TaxID=1317129 RepID=A0AAN5DGW9_9BILA|nr:hypothetical protein PMAYCL1PPCAC_32492 [Pristionchus mayeri]
MNALLFSSFLIALVSQAAAQCGSSDSPNCASWAANGFCTNTAYTLAMRQQYCGTRCGLCTATAAPGAGAGACTADANARCAVWVANGFCTNSFYTQEQKTQYCCKSCGGASGTTTTAEGTTTTAAGGTTTTTTGATTTTTTA